MLSILIPVYNYDISELIIELDRQLQRQTVICEVIIADDCSTDEELLKKNSSTCNRFEKIRYIGLKKNIGRSAIRNLLAKEATHENLLFLDADVIPKENSFINNYISLLHTNYEIIYGGIVYDEKRPSKNQVLRWVYGNARESVSANKRQEKPYINFLTLNFLIKKSTTEKLRFNEEIPNLRCEDTLFSMDAKNKKVKVEHVDNVVIHKGLDTSEMFLKKSLEAVSVRVDFVKQGLLEDDYTKLTEVANLIRKMKIGFIFSYFFKLTKHFFEKNFLSNRPSMFYFDLYRLGYYFYYEKNSSVIE